MAKAPAGERQPARARLRGVLAVLPIGGGLALLPHLQVAGSRMVPVLQAVLPLLCLLALAVCLFLVLRRARGAAVLLLAAIAAAMLPVVQVPAEAGCDAGVPWGVLTLNAGRGHADPAGLAEVITASRPDVMFLVETSEPMVDALARAVPDWDYTWRSDQVPTGGTVDTVILSRHPMAVELPAARQVDGALFDVPVALIEHREAGAIRVAGIHPVPPTHGPASWSDTLATVGQWARAQDETPLVLAGDFNATRAHPQFRALATGFGEAPRARGPLALGTWPANGPVPAFAPIDHVLARGLEVRSAERFVVEGTDHHGIVAQLHRCR